MEKIIKIKTSLIEIQIWDRIEWISWLVNKIQKISDWYAISSDADPNPSHKAMFISSMEAVIYYSYE